MNWKWGFFILLGVNVLVLGSIWLLFSPIGSDTPSPEERPEGSLPEGEVFFSAETSLEQISTYMQMETDDVLDINMEGEEIVFTGTYEFFGVGAELSLYLLPTVTDSGNLRLEENGLSLGPFNLPSSTALEAIRQQADLPEYVQVYPEEQIIDVHINDIDIGEQMYLRIASSDFEDGTIQLEGVLPDG
ncbi:YpmS family protein [Natribacillus halophilus]|uniref:Uncharacterized protein YpmS n=1 Tax=Natribacillus halophilus TaxID=549003 RepID=A0A1G8NWN0_9BACI|nr:YpmS family protein [Natribacillus halophilus]SDI84565.1 Uncharacterized protein YpmS [Natribacillus halophilus]